MRLKTSLRAGLFTLAIIFTQISDLESAESVEQSTDDVQGTVNQIAGHNNKISRDAIANTSENNNTSSVIINIRTSTDKIIAELPESNREIADEVKEIAIDMVAAASTPNDSEKKDKIVKKLTGLSLLSYQASSNPFLSSINRVQLMCGNVFKLAYRGLYSASQERIRLSVNNRTSGWLHPGDTYRAAESGQNLEVLYLEFNKDSKSPVLHYNCKAAGKS